MDDSPFVVDIKESALDQNEAVEEYLQGAENPIGFGSRDEAEALARLLTEKGGTPVRLQQVAPQDPKNIDSYLVANPGGDPRRPVAKHRGSWVFEPTGYQYGSLGESLVLCRSQNPPPLMPYIRDDIDAMLSTISDLPYNSVDDIDLHVKLDRQPDPVISKNGDEFYWYPDCTVEAWLGYPGRFLRRYWCEIKTGDASFERGQMQAMEYKAQQEPVLKIRITLDDLPDQYTVRINEI